MSTNSHGDSTDVATTRAIIPKKNQCLKELVRTRLQAEAPSVLVLKDGRGAGEDAKILTQNGGVHERDHELPQHCIMSNMILLAGKFHPHGLNKGLEFRKGHLARAAVADLSIGRVDGLDH